MFEIEEIEPAERAGFPSAHFSAQGFPSGFLAYQTQQKIMEMSPEELFKLLQVAIIAENTGELSLAVRLPTRNELLD